MHGREAVFALYSGGLEELGEIRVRQGAVRQRLVVRHLQLRSTGQLRRPAPLLAHHPIFISRQQHC
ncbi:unnamed protein product [Linum tenue]|uniref:Uncharacterized protein n=1 Tax=Linum tenue TaxID=586396 RepID=A0AAV0J4M1_9ROSI|nr:unnamed protein product [Linum tenue]